MSRWRKAPKFLWGGLKTWARAGTTSFVLWVASMAVWFTALWLNALDWWNFVPLAASVSWALAWTRGWRRGWNDLAALVERHELEQFARWLEQILERAADDPDCSEEQLAEMQDSYRRAKSRLAELAQ